eukprot:GFYU01009170.1.p1 GENE.GFYU01009170.1~~GFYU01009170.1.p1  ORF type:complete len:418 (+),score=137.41 GFYU01009170.1:64-1317(+)
MLMLSRIASVVTLVVVLVAVGYVWIVNPTALSGRSYRSVQAQSLHYISRVHSSIRTEPLHSAADWKGSDLQDSTEWVEVLSKDVQAEIVACVSALAASGVDMKTLTKSDYTWPLFQRVIEGTRVHVGATGRGFVLVRGSPLDRLSTEREREFYFWGVGLYLGEPGAQNKEEDLLGRVTDLGADPNSPLVRAYKTNAHIGFHVDFADVVGLLCVQQAATGGESLLVSSVRVYNTLLEENPELIPELYKPMAQSTKGEGGINWFPIHLVRHHEGYLRSAVHVDYLKSVYEDHADAPLHDRTRALKVLAAYEEVLNRPGMALEMKMQPGDIQLVSNHVLLHSRKAYTDVTPPSPVTARGDAAASGDSDSGNRLLLRLWISLQDGPETTSYTAAALKEFARASQLGQLIWRRIETKVSALF